MESKESTRKHGEGLVVTEKGIRVSGAVHQTESSAAQESAQRKKKQLHEKSGAPAPEIKQQLFS